MIGLKMMMMMNQKTTVQPAISGMCLHAAQIPVAGTLQTRKSGLSKVRE
jgi:hypothetical protein